MLASTVTASRLEVQNACTQAHPASAAVVWGCLMSTHATSFPGLCKISQHCCPCEERGAQTICSMSERRRVRVLSLISRLGAQEPVCIARAGHHVQGSSESNLSCSANWRPTRAIHAKQRVLLVHTSGCHGGNIICVQTSSQFTPWWSSGSTKKRVLSDAYGHGGTMRVLRLGWDICFPSQAGRRLSREPNDTAPGAAKHTACSTCEHCTCFLKTPAAQGESMNVGEERTAQGHEHVFHYGLDNKEILYFCLPALTGETSWKFPVVHAENHEAKKPESSVSNCHTSFPCQSAWPPQFSSIFSILGELWKIKTIITADWL